MIFIAACLYMRVYKGCVDSYHGPEAETLNPIQGKVHGGKACALPRLPVVHFFGRRMSCR